MHTPSDPAFREEIAEELHLIWASHARLKLAGVMRLYTIEGTDPWRAQAQGYSLWFGPEDVDKAVDAVISHYNDGNLPNSPLLLDPVVYDAPDGKALGCSFIWGTGFARGVETLEAEQEERIRALGVCIAHFHRGESTRAGMKMLAFTDTVVPAAEDGGVEGHRELCDVAGFSGEEYWPYYLLSNVSYLSKHGSYAPVPLRDALNDGEPITADNMAALTKQHAISPQTVIDAFTCWKAYDRRHGLYIRFGINTDDIDWNLRFYDLCARDFDLFNAVGPMRQDATESMDFVVPGYIARGSITLLSGSAGTGKSSLAHHLCVLASQQWKKGDPSPMWLGQPLNMQYCDGICVYFSGEDGPAIINERARLYDPEGKAERIMYQRVEFGEDMNFPKFMRYLKKMPQVPVMVIDPARKYLTGDEDDSGVVSEFFEAIEEYAIEKNTAVLVVHHLAKGANPKSAREVLDCLRGSQVFIDRPRVVLGMYRDGPYTVVGLAKSNIPPSLGMVMEERVFARDPDSLTLLWLPGEKGIRRDGLSDEELADIRKKMEKTTPAAKKKKKS